MKSLRALLIVATGLVLSNEVAAACKKNALSGTYQIYATGANSSSFIVTQCTIKVASNGAIRSSGTCDSTSGISKVTGGQLKIKKNCNVTGELRTTDFVTTIVQSLMYRTKDAIAGSFVDDSGTVGTFHAVKR